ncbi:MAG TPA: hypothetical protein VHX42_01140 [Candidatus Babeliales bacterium]|nr:hypothetical protein [Candidatus Babeliales bacterium]
MSLLKISLFSSVFFTCIYMNAMENPEYLTINAELKITALKLKTAETKSQTNNAQIKSLTTQEIYKQYLLNNDLVKKHKMENQVYNISDNVLEQQKKACNESQFHLSQLLRKQQRLESASIIFENRFKQGKSLVEAQDPQAINHLNTMITDLNDYLENEKS